MAPYAFLSSPVYDSSRGIDLPPVPSLREIRKFIHDLNLPGDKKIWVDERDKQRPPTDPAFHTLDDLFRLIRESSVFLVLLAGRRYGTPVSVGDERAHASFWELELFYAALIRKPVQVFLVDDFDPEPQLASLLTILRGALPRDAWSGPHSRRKIVSAVREFLLEQIKQDTANFPARRLLNRLIDGLFHLRGRDGLGGSAERESIGFLGGIFRDPTVRPNRVVIQCLLDEISSLADEERRLTRLWMVYRELDGAPFDDARSDVEFLPYWNTFFGKWAAAGFWYGLHGHPHLAVLPALVDQAKVRERMRSIGSSAWRHESTHYPGGALASSRYSIAGNTRSWNNRRSLLHAARRDLDRALQEGIEPPTNLLAIRGSVYRRLGAIRASVEDYEAVLAQRQSSGAADAAVGEALSELGYGYLFELRFRRGKAFLEEGVRLLARSNPRPGFLIRAKRKLATAYVFTGHPLRAREQLHEALSLAQKHRVLDQIR